jgi:hypothetical protein
MAGRVAEGQRSQGWKAREAREARGVKGVDEAHRRQDGGESPRQHRCARPRRAEQEEMMSTMPHLVNRLERLGSSVTLRQPSMGTVTSPRRVFVIE